MTLQIELDEPAEIVHLIVDNHLVLTAERRSPNHIIYRNFDALVDDKIHDTIKEIAAALLELTGD